MKKSKKGILSIILSFIMLFVITGCGNKTVITERYFINKAEKHNYEVVDVTNDYNSGSVEKVLTINLRDGEIYFHVLSDENAAVNLFNKGKEYYLNYKSGTSSEVSSSMGNYSSYSLTSKGYYMYICRVDNTLIATRVKESSKEVIKTFIKELGY